MRRKTSRLIHKPNTSPVHTRQAQASSLNSVADQASVSPITSGAGHSIAQVAIVPHQASHELSHAIQQGAVQRPNQEGMTQQSGMRALTIKQQSDANKVHRNGDEKGGTAAPTMTHETKFSAPDGSDKTRKKVGVGEKVDFTGSATGKWTASSGTPDKLANGSKFEWTAPKRATTSTIKLEVADKSVSVTMDVLEPNAIIATKNREITYTAGEQGAGMKLDFNFQPKSVSFGNIQIKEVSHAASNIEGYFKLHGMPHDHNTGDTFVAVSEDNKLDSAEDTASTSGYPSPWSDGKFDWLIPNHFRLKTEGGDGKKYTTVTQAFKIEGPSGKTTITKAGAKVERTP